MSSDKDSRPILCHPADSTSPFSAPCLPETLQTSSSANEIVPAAVPEVSTTGKLGKEDVLVSVLTEKIGVETRA